MMRAFMRAYKGVVGPDWIAKVGGCCGEKAGLAVRLEMIVKHQERPCTTISRPDSFERLSQPKTSFRREEHNRAGSVRAKGDSVQSRADEIGCS